MVNDFIKKKKKEEKEIGSVNVFKNMITVFCIRSQMLSTCLCWERDVIILFVIPPRG